MMHKPIQFKNICFSLPHKRCFEQFNETISYAQRIAIIGQNGSGKSTLLRLIQNLIKPTDGELIIPHDLVVGYVPQLIDKFESLSGGQRFNKQLTEALACFPTILLLDEPTNHMDRKNRQYKKQVLVEQISGLRIPDVIKPKFSIHSGESGRVLVSITDGNVGFENPIITSINLSVRAGERIAISGDNGSGKSTLIRAILEDISVAKTGSWQVLRREYIGYLDQHYSTLYEEKTVLDTLQTYVSNWSYTEIRMHLNDFLFRKNEEINTPVASLSGGEKARFSLALIAAITPKLLILDEITNNLDLETRAHVAEKF